MLNHFSHVWLFVTLWTAALQAPLSMEFSRQEYWSGLPWLAPGNLPHPEIQPVHSEGDQPWDYLEGMMLKLKLQYFGHLMWKVDSLEKTLMQEDKGTTEDELARWHHWLDGREFEWTLGVGDGEGGLECCNSWGRKESDMTERLNWTELICSIR